MPQEKDVTAEDSARTNGNVGAVMVVGGGVAGIQAALDMANSGFYVHLVETKPAIGGVMAQLDKTFPTNDCSMCIISPKLVECGRHLNIEIHTLTDVTGIDGEPGNLKVTLKKQPRYVDLAKCTGCGECANVCPVTISDAFNAGLADWKAAYRLYPQAIPAAFGIKKLDRAPCTLTCPAEINVQGYVQLIKLGKYEEAVKLIMERLPLPGVLGRVCPHPCESKCRRAELDESVAICNLKRFAADQVDLSALSPPLVEAKSDRVAIIGSGPAGLACAYHLALKGYRPTIFEALPKAGGMLRVGIPDYRLPKDILDREIDNILRLGVELKTNTALGRDFTLDKLLEEGYKAVFLGIGCHVGKPLGIPGEEAEGVIQGVEFLRRANLKEPLTVGKRLAVIGGGNVAIDVACTARRLGSEVTIVYRRSREEMPAFAHEIEQATCEGVEIVYLAAPLRAVTGKDGKVNGLICQKMELGEPDASGRRRPVPIEGAEFELPVDMVVPAIGQEAAQGPLAACGVKMSRWGTIEVNEVTYETSRPGVFAAGDVHTGPWIAIEAVGGGIEAAESIDRYLRGADMVEGRSVGEEAHKRWAEIPKDEEGAPREVMATLPPEHTCACFDEISLGYTEEQAQREAARCLNCGVCSECMQCVLACQAGAIDHSMKAETKEVKVGAVILSPGFQTFSPASVRPTITPGYPNVVTSLEFERILSASGPFGGHLVRPSDHQEPKKIAWLQCVGSRDVKYHTYCSSVCCMYAIKEAVIAKEHAPYPLDAAIFFMDMRTFGKDFELYYNRAKDEHGVRFIRSRIHSIDPVPDDNLQIRLTDESGEEKREAFDMIVLSVGMEVSQTGPGTGPDPGGGHQLPRFCGHLALRARGGLPGRHLCLRGHAGSQRHSRIGHAGVGRGRGGERLLGGRPLDRDQDPAGAHTQGHQTGRRTPHRGVRLQLRHQHRRHHQRAGAGGIRQDAAQRGLRGRQPVHLLPGHPGQYDQNHRRAQPQPGGGGGLHPHHPRAPVPGDPDRRRFEQVSLRDGQHPQPGLLGAHEGARQGHGQGQRPGADGGGPGLPAQAPDGETPDHQPAGPGHRRRGRRSQRGPQPGGPGL